jgi:hypothetical protein
MIRIPLSDSDAVEYLTRRKFPLYPHIEVPAFPAFSSVSTSSGMPRENKQKYIKDIESYKSELRAKSTEELRDLCRHEQEKERQELQAKRELDDQQQFFNLPDAKADFRHWSKAAHWTLDEAVALSFGRAPEVVKWDSVKDLVKDSPFAAKYGRVRDLALRAKAWKQLYDPVLPGIFLAWARRMEIEVPPELVVQVEARGIVIADWKDMFDKLKTQSADDGAVMLTFLGAKQLEIAELTQERDRLRERVAELEQAAQEARVKGKPLLTKERESLLKLIIGMAVKVYRYDPAVARNEATAKISRDLESLGIPLDDDTVRKWLREGGNCCFRKSRKPKPLTEFG